MARRRLLRLALAVAAGSCLAAAAARAAAGPAAAAPDSALSELPELVVSGQAAAPPAPGRTRVAAAAVGLRDAGSLADVGALLPSVRISTTSRGERHPMLRGAPERHVQTFLDGIPLNLPWDERVDLETVPLTGLERLEGRRGLETLLEGPGVLAGSVRILPPSLQDGRPRTRLGAGGGGHGLGRLQLMRLTRRGDWDLLGAGSWQKRDAWTLPGGAERANSDLEQGALLLRASRPLAGTGRLNFLATGWSAVKGVPPELHLGEDARFWRYPLRRRALAGASLLLPLGRDGNWDLTAMTAVDVFEQEIDPRGPDGWDQPVLLGQDYEKNWDRTAHLQTGLTRWLGAGGRLSLQGDLRYAHHRESLAGGDPVLAYAQWLGGLVAECELRPARAWTLTAGAGWDAAATPESGDKERADTFDAPALNLRLARDLGPRARAYLAASRRSRFPSLRELYSGALDKFVLNPELRPERQDLAEAGLSAGGGRWRAGGAVFLQRLRDGIEKEKLPDGSGRFQRVNRTAIRVPGLEAYGGWRAAADLDLDARLTLLGARVEDAAGDFVLPAEDRPDYLGGCAVNWRPARGPGLLAETTVVGPRWCADATAASGLTRLPAAAVWNLRLSWRWDGATPRGAGHALELYLRLDNVFDQPGSFQVGLPAPGRTAGAGVAADL